jgi:hypothetical protein
MSVISGSSVKPFDVIFRQVRSVLGRADTIPVSSCGVVFYQKPGPGQSTIRQDPRVSRCERTGTQNDANYRPNRNL